MRRRGAPVPGPGGAGSSSLSILHTFDQEMNPARPVRPSPLTTHQSGMPLDLLDRLRSFPLFQTAPEEFLAAIAQHIRPQQHAPRDYILTEGDEAKAMYWLVRGAVAVTSRDGESTYFELKPGAFFGEIGILMDIPRTATIIARTRCLLVVLTKDALRRELPRFPDVEKSIREEAMERLSILEKKKEGAGRLRVGGAIALANSGMDQSLPMGATMLPPEGHASVIVSAGAQRTTNESVFATGELNIRQVLKELPLFANLETEILHFLGMNATPITYPPFTPIVLQNSPGTEIFFIIQGEVEVVDHSAEISLAGSHTPHFTPESGRVVAKLRKGDHFGEVAGLGLTTKRMATVRTIGTVECLVIEGNVLEELWRRWNGEMKREVEATARRRLSTADQADVDKMELDVSSAGGSGRSTPTYSISRMDLADASAKLASHLKEASGHSDSPLKRSITPPSAEIETSLPGINVIEPLDPDPFLPAEFDSMRAKSRRGSLAPPVPTSSVGQAAGEADSERPISPSPNKSKHPTTPPEHYTSAKRARIVQRRTTQFNKGALRDDILIKVFEFLELHELMRLRQVSTHWAKVLNTNREILRVLDLKPYNRLITDEILMHVIVPFVGSRPEIVDISNCYHITDEGFTVLANVCAPNAKIWKMKSVWDITGQAILEMSNKARGLEEIDLSNCRKVSDTLLARVTGWVVPEMHPMYAQLQQLPPTDDPAKLKQHQMMYPPPGTVIGCPQLKNITLSYCKHVTDRTMSHLAVHAAARLEKVDLTRCTTITDQGFQHWSITRFPNLTELCLADCTYLTDSAIVFLTNAAKRLKVLDLSFCCALSDTATEVLSLGCQKLTHLKLSFCGSAVSDSSLRAISLHLLDLKELSVRGCVRVTGVGVEAVVEGCTKLEAFDVSQCKNLTRWLEGGGVERCRRVLGRNIRFDISARNTLAGDRMR